MAIQCNYNVKVYLPINKTKYYKASIRGFWKGTRLFYDYIVKTESSINNLEALRQEHKQESLFYTKSGKAYLYNGTTTQELKFYEHILLPKKFKGLKALLKAYLKIYGGFTIYIKESGYLLEAWK